MWQRNVLLKSFKLVTGARADWGGVSAGRAQRIYFSNHCSHLDTLAILSALPPALRDATRPVAARDYWGRGPLKRYVAQRLMNAVLIDRGREDGADPLDPVRHALCGGASLILFPEGTRSARAVPGPFKSGLFRLAREFPHVELLPVLLENLHHVMPKGALLPVPLLARVSFGAPLKLERGEARESFLERARGAVIALRRG